MTCVLEVWGSSFRRALRACWIVMEKEDKGGTMGAAL